MTAIHVVDWNNSAEYASTLRDHHRLRHHIFVEERGWTGLRQADGLERDAYDDAESVYLLAIDEGRVVGGARLRPTLAPHMLADVFSHLATRGVPRGPDIWEWTRHFVVRERRTGRTDCRLLAAVQEFCLDRGIVALTAVVETWWLPRWQQVGFRTKPLGLPQEVAGQPTLAVSVAISEESLASVRAFARLDGRSLAPANPESRTPVHARVH